MRALVLGCGEMGETAARDLHRHAGIQELVVATRRPQRARDALRDLGAGPPRLEVTDLDASDDQSLDAALRGCAVAVNCVGPNFRHEERVARAAIRARVSLVDLNDEYEVTSRVLALDGAAREAGITIVLGLGASPGVNNVLVRSAADQLDEVEEIHTAWVMSAADPGGPALAAHLLYSLSDRAPTVVDGRVQWVRSLRDGRQRIDFPPPVGPTDVFHVGHPEPLTLHRSFPGARVVDDKATFNPPAVNEMILRLGRLAREAPADLAVAGQTMDPMDFCAAYLRAFCKSLPGVRPEGALRVQVKGRKGERARTITFSSAGRLATGTGIPAAIGAILILEGRVTARGVLPPEDCLDPNEFLYELFNRRNAGKLNGWVEEAPLVPEPLPIS
jgi:saccharopine dehydrogenase (NAD+, L-lysine-forming)